MIAYACCAKNVSKIVEYEEAAKLKKVIGLNMCLISLNRFWLNFIFCTY